MNIFVVDENPFVAASMLCDQHVVKMVTESAQLLATAHRVLESQHAVPYKPTHHNHPCSVWARQTTGNYTWLYAHACGLALEFKCRFGHSNHKAIENLPNLSVVPSKLPFGGVTKFALAMPDLYKALDTVEAYRNYYNGEKLKFARWTRCLTGPPDWVTQN